MSRTRSGLVYDVAYIGRTSIVDAGPCTRRWCLDIECRCQECPICHHRCAAQEFDFWPYDNPKNNVWVGPHCTRCEFYMNLFNTPDTDEEQEEEEETGDEAAAQEEIPPIDEYADFVRTLQILNTNLPQTASA